MDDWVTIPFYDEQDELVGATARAGETNTSQAKYCNPNGQDPNLLYVPSWDLVKSSNKVFLTFGILDAVSIYQLGYASASTTTGKRIDPEAFDSIRKTIFICPDEGEEVSASLLSTRLGWRGKTLKMNWPEDCKDINDVKCKHGNDMLLSLLKDWS